MRNTHEDETDTLTLKELYQYVTMPSSKELAWTLIRPYVPDRHTPARILVGMAQSIGVGLVVITALGLMAFCVLSCYVYLGPLAGVIVFLILSVVGYDAADAWLEGLFRRDDESIRVAQEKANNS